MNWKTGKKYLLMLIFSSLISIAFMDETQIPHGQENLTTLTYMELQALADDIATASKTYHVPSKDEQKAVLAATQKVTEKHFADKGLKVSGWAWYDSEYSYTKDWDFYSVKTHLDYKDSNNKSKKSNVYSEVYDQDNIYTVIYLEIDDTAVLDKRSDNSDSLWSKQPKSFINQASGIDLSTYTEKELSSLYNKVKEEYEESHGVTKNVASIILSLTKSELEQYCLEKNIEIKSYAWYDDEYTYLRDWDYYWLETHVDYVKSGSSQEKDKLFSEVCSVNGKMELIYLKMGDTVVMDKRDVLITTFEDGIPRYSWANENGTEKDKNIEKETTPEEMPQDINTIQEALSEITPQIIYVTPEPAEEITPQIIYVTPEPDSKTTPQIIYVTPRPVESNGIFNISLNDATDDELLEAANAIKEEQKSRIKTRIILDPVKTEVLVGKIQDIKAEVTGLPDGESMPKLEWATSDKTIATCKNGQVKGMTGGTVVITCGATLSDGTLIQGECSVVVKIPISSITSDQKKINLNVGGKKKLEFTLKPENATEKDLRFESSDSDVITVNADGIVEATGAGQATITAYTKDGSDKKVAITIKVEDHRISEDTIARLLMYAMGNDVAEDIFTSDGNYFDKRKLHDYRYFDAVLEVVSRGKWTTNDGGNNWHVENAIVRHRYYRTYRQYSFDIGFDGKNYVMSNGWVTYASSKSELRKLDPSKYGENDLSNLDYYIYLVISPKQVGE